MWYLPVKNFRPNNESDRVYVFINGVEYLISGCDLIFSSGDEPVICPQCPVIGVSVLGRCEKSVLIRLPFTLGMNLEVRIDSLIFVP